MTRYLLHRLLWALPMLFGITLSTFVLLDWLPLDRAEAQVQAAMQGADAEQRAKAVHELRVRLGMVDPVTGEARSAWSRYVTWVGHAARLEFGGGARLDGAGLTTRLADGLIVSALVGSIATLIAVALGTWLGVRAGRRRGSPADRAASGVVLAGYALPEFLVVTLLLLLFGGGLGDAWFPTSGLTSPGAEEFSTFARILDLAAHLVLPVVALALVPTAIVLRHVREATARAERSPFVAAMRSWGVADRDVRRRVARHGFTPVATLVGTLLPAIVGGSVVVEEAFALPGIGRMAFRGVLDKDVEIVMAVTLVVSVATLIALTLSDVLHRALDRRVELR